MGGGTTLVGVGGPPPPPSTLALGAPAASHVLSVPSQRGLCSIIGFP